MIKEENLFDRDGIEQLLRNYSPSELDSQLLRPCPFFEDETREFTSAYGAIHRMAQSRLLVKLQVRLDGLSVKGETKGDDGERVDGVVSEYRISLNNRKIELRPTDCDEPRDITAIEVKTGNVSPLQAAAYVYKRDLPAIVAEMKTGDVHLVDAETALKLLSEAVDHQKDLETLRRLGRKIPDYYQCRNCGNRDCEYYERGKRQTGNGVIREKCKIFDNIDEIIEKILVTLGEILENEEYLTFVQDNVEARLKPTDIRVNLEKRGKVYEL